MNSTEIERLLPYIFRRTNQDDNPLVAIIEAMSALHQPTETLLANVKDIINPLTAQDKFVPFLAGWLDLERLFDEFSDNTIAASTHPPITTGINCLRALTASAAYLSRWRGTKKGLIHFLEIATDTRGFVIDEQVVHQEQIIPFHLKVQAPASLLAHRALIQRIIESEKPAYVTYELEFVETEKSSKN